MHGFVGDYTLLVSDLDKGDGAEAPEGGVWHTVKVRGPAGEPGLRTMLALPLGSTLSAIPTHDVQGPKGPKATGQ
eukprot:9010081-Alexandrium_andersonii.AAC.1